MTSPTGNGKRVDMALSEFEKKRIERLFAGWCAKRVPLHVQDRFRVEFEVRGNEVKLFEARPHWQDAGSWIASKVARFKKDETTNCWQLFSAGRDGRWRLFEPYPISINIAKLLAVVEKDSTGIFWK
jgi:Protein of unknown function (DUF3024)